METETKGRLLPAYIVGGAIVLSSFIGSTAWLVGSGRYEIAVAGEGHGSIVFRLDTRTGEICHVSDAGRSLNHQHEDEDGDRLRMSRCMWRWSQTWFDRVGGALW